jgi:sugar phosphate isomerase/epimerase
VKIALDPYMFRSTPLLELPALIAELGYEYIELSPRADFTPFFLHPRADDETVKAFRPSLSEGQFWESMEELMPVFERDGVELGGPGVSLVVKRVGRGQTAAGAVTVTN